MTRVPNVQRVMAAHGGRDDPDDSAMELHMKLMV